MAVTLALPGLSFQTRSKAQAGSAAALTAVANVSGLHRHCGLGLICGSDFLPEEAEAQAELATAARQQPGRKQQQD